MRTNRGSFVKRYPRHYRAVGTGLNISTNSNRSPNVPRFHLGREPWTDDGCSGEIVCFGIDGNSRGQSGKVVHPDAGSPI